MKTSQGESGTRSSFEFNPEPWDKRRPIVLQMMRERMDRYNMTKGNLDPNEVDCPYCLNRGYMGYVVDNQQTGAIYDRFVECDCLRVRKNMKNVTQSGMGDAMKANTFENFEVKNMWQSLMLKAAKEYLNAGVGLGKWLFIGGQPGSGKTHICTAVAGELLQQGLSLFYVVWPQVVRRLKNMMTDSDAFDREIAKYQEADVLYIDDLFKPVTDSTGTAVTPLITDVKIAFELLNYRYQNDLPTIISSELYANEIADEVDEAIGSRISEKADGYTVIIGRDKARNYRFKHNWNEEDAG